MLFCPTIPGTLYRVPTGQGKLEKVREIAWSGKVRENLTI